jgi:hypothetical protein
MAISATKRKQCKLNAKKSTGPRTTAGKHAVRYNAVKHAGSAKTPVLPWEDRAAFDELAVGYKNWMQPVGEIEVALVDQAALASWQHARATRSDVARVTFNIHTARANEQREAAESAAALGQRLFFEQHGPLALHPRPDSAAFGERTVWSKTPDDPDHPSRLVMSLEATFAGVMWLLARWSELRSRLEGGECWHAPEKLKAVRMLGKLSYDAADDRDVCAIYLCSHVLDPQHQDDPFFEIKYDMEPADYKRFRERLVRRNVESMRPSDTVTARLNLLDLVERKMDRLNMLSDQRLAFDDAMNALKTDIMGFDDSVEGERLRRHIAASDRALHRAIATIIKMRKDLETPEFGPTETAAGHGAAASGQSEIENTEAKVEAQREELQTPEPTTTETEVDDPKLEDGRAENVRTSDLQNKPTDAGDEPQVQSPAEVQQPTNAADNDGDFGLVCRQPSIDGLLGRARPKVSCFPTPESTIDGPPEAEPSASIREQDVLGETPRPPAVGPLTPPRVRPEVSSFPTLQSNADAPLEDKPTAAIREQDDPTQSPPEDVGRPSQNGPSAADGHLARHQPVLSVSSHDDEQPARQQPVPAASPAESSIPDQKDDDRMLEGGCADNLRAGDLQNEPTGAGDESQVQALSNISPDREPEDPPSRFTGPMLSGGLHGQVMRELRRRELEQSQMDGFRRPDCRGRRAPRLRNAQAFRRPQALEVPGDFPVLASLPPPDFSRVLAEVHREFEEEIEKSANKTRSLT